MTAAHLHPSRLAQLQAFWPLSEGIQSPLAPPLLGSSSFCGPAAPTPFYSHSQQCSHPPQLQQLQHSLPLALLPFHLCWLTAPPAEWTQQQSLPLRWLLYCFRMTPEQQAPRVWAASAYLYRPSMHVHASLYAIY